MKCPECNLEMIRRKSKFSNSYWWGCSNFPDCKVTCAEHPDGTLASTPCTEEDKRLRQEAHKTAEDIWGKWESRKCKKREMYYWLEHNTKSKHIGHMNKDELIKTISDLKVVREYANV